MVTYKVVNADSLGADLTEVADAIREKSGTTKDLDFPSEFKSVVKAIPRIVKKEGWVRFDTDQMPPEGSTIKPTVPCDGGAKLFVLEPDDETLANIKLKKSGNWTLWVRASFVGTSTDGEAGSLAIYMAKSSGSGSVGMGGQQAKNDNGVELTCFPLVAGKYNWTAYYWDE